MATMMRCIFIITCLVTLSLADVYDIIGPSGMLARARQNFGIDTLVPQFYQELGIKNDQKLKIEELLAKNAQLVQDTFLVGEPVAPEIYNEVRGRQSLNEEIMLVLTQEQRKKCRRLILQRRTQEFGWYVLFHSQDVSESLEKLRITEEQITYLSASAKTLRNQFSNEVREGARRMRARLSKIRDEALQNELAVLTTTQKNLLDRLVEKPQTIKAGASPKLRDHLFKIAIHTNRQEEYFKLQRELIRKHEQLTKANDANDPVVDKLKQEIGEFKAHQNKFALKLLGEDLPAFQQKVIAQSIEGDGISALLRITDAVPQVEVLRITESQIEALAKIRKAKQRRINELTRSYNQVIQKMKANANRELLAHLTVGQQQVLEAELGSDFVNSVCLIRNLTKTP